MTSQLREIPERVTLPANRWIDRLAEIEVDLGAYVPARDEDAAVVDLSGLR